MHTSNAAHPQATIALHTGSINFVRPSLGSWVTYGLGSESQDLPALSRSIPWGRAVRRTTDRLFARLLPRYPRVDLEAGGIADIRNRHLTEGRQRAQIDLIQEMNRDLLAKQPGNPELDGVIQSFELAYRMQTSVPSVLNLEAEKPETLERYGIGAGATNDFGTQCLMARRLAESGVRFIQVSKGGWDQHRELKEKLTENCTAIDKPSPRSSRTSRIATCSRTPSSSGAVNSAAAPRTRPTAATDGATTTEVTPCGWPGAG